MKFSNMEFSDLMFYSPKEKNTKTLARCRFTFNNCFVMQELEIVDGINGRFVKYPCVNTGDNTNYSSVFYPTNRQFREELENWILEEYEEGCYKTEAV